ncbi:MAG: hypothetical protein ACFFDN_44575 [Candidatus Hodarchaeota archaeon]
MKRTIFVPKPGNVTMYIPDEEKEQQPNPPSLPKERFNIEKIIKFLWVVIVVLIIALILLGKYINRGIKTTAQTTEIQLIDKDGDGIIYTDGR